MKAVLQMGDAAPNAVNRNVTSWVIGGGNS
jgi:hypothetical protein